MRTLSIALRTTLMLAAALVSSPKVSAQLTAEWTTVYAVATNPIRDIIRDMACAGKGRYVIMMDSQILRTTDGGTTWSSVIAREELTPVFTHIASADAGSLVVTRDSTTFGNSWTHGIIEASTDAGAIWTRTVLPELSRLGDVEMLDRLHGIACAYVRDSPGSIYRTSDGGLTWQTLPMPPRSAGPFGLQMLSADAWAMRAYDSLTTTWGLFRTADAGITWTRLAVPANISSIEFIDSMLAFGAGGVYPPGDGNATHDRIVRTTDGGATWMTVLENPVERSWALRDIAFADRDHGIAVGGIGMIYRTTDGGATWLKELATSDLLEFGFASTAVEYPSPDEAIVVGNVGAITYRGRQTLVPPRITSPTWLPNPGPLEQIIRWTAVAGATRYDVQVGDTIYDYEYTNNRYFDVPYFATTTSDTSVPVTLGEHARYYFRVRARNDSLVSDWSERAHKRTIGVPVIVPMPMITHPADLATDVPLETDLTWTPIPNAFGYDYVIGLEPTFFFVAEAVENAQGTSARLEKLSPNTQYYAEVRARDSSGELSEYDAITFWTAAVSSVDETAAIVGSASLRPNVATDRTTLHLTLARPSTVRIRVVDLAGAEVLVMAPVRVDAGDRALPIELSTLASGRYTVAVDIDGRTLVLPFAVVD
jgi:photosystem II stability/assembly factor-like uncharacterized protein